MLLAVVVFLVAWICHHDAAAVADLRCGEADAGRGVHRLGHVCEQLAQGRSELVVSDRTGLLGEDRMRCLEDGQDRHGRSVG